MTAIEVPGDKSISHRILMLATLAEGPSTVQGILRSDDVRATVDAMRRLGASIHEDGNETRIVGPVRWLTPEGEIDCVNSGTTARLLLGLLAGLGIRAVIRGDPSLSRRPMERVVYPLQAMGARIRYLTSEGTLPLELSARRSGSLRSLKHRPRVASAQVKSSILFAGLAGGTRVEVSEAQATRDHTERLLDAMGAPISVDRTEDGGAMVCLEPDRQRSELSPLRMSVPGDFSSAAFLLAAGWLGAGKVEVRRVGLNPTRTGLLDVAGGMGARFEVGEDDVQGHEPTGGVRASPSRLRPCDVDSRSIPRLVDEIPVLAILAARAAGVSRIRGAEELRWKESDRLAVLATNLGRLGVRCRELADGLEIEGTDAPLTGRVQCEGDHRIAMAFGALGATPGCRISVDDASCVSVSYPSFWHDLERISASEAA
ncbi:MAG: 3-phosphoshikimate 1-carboxyvinyltransferase [Gemmatimonadales bacterium]|jgi:3-phosphoshikimate 1-carboxyvinyltransferase